MCNLGKVCGELYAAKINSLDVNLMRKTIQIELTINKKTDYILKFYNVSSFLWLEKDDYAHESYDFSDCDYYELTSIDFQNITTDTNNIWLKQYSMDYNVVIEIWESVLLINSTELSINSQIFKINSNG